MVITFTHGGMEGAGGNVYPDIVFYGCIIDFGSDWFFRYDNDGMSV